MNDVTGHELSREKVEQLALPHAVAALRAAVALEPTAPGAIENLQHVLSSAVQRWHYRMLNDRRRNETYATAIAAALGVLPASASVLDIGTGTGLLAMLAARAGNTQCHVWACDCSAVMTTLAPSLRNILVYSSPMPLAPPVTSTFISTLKA